MIIIEIIKIAVSVFLSGLLMLLGWYAGYKIVGKDDLNYDYLDKQ